MSGAVRRDAAQQRLHAYHDGELSALGRWRFERRLRRSPELRRELEALRGLSTRMRAGLGADPSPDLWDSIAMRLPALDARREEAAAPAQGPGAGAWAWRGLVAASLALVAVLAVQWVQPAAPVLEGGVVRWLDSGGRDVMVLEASSDTTIIWVFEAVDQAAGRGVLLDVV